MHAVDVWREPPAGRVDPAALRGRVVPFHPTVRVIWRDGLAVFAVSLALRVLFSALTAGTYDPDEFVVLALGKEMARGDIPYRDFMFFHPPGMLVVSHALQPLIALWWPVARVFTLLVDSLSALLVWRIGALIYRRREAIAAGLLYGASPIALLGAVRVGQDPLITALGLIGLLVLLQRRSQAGAIVAGVCLGLAVWLKYPALLFLPVYALVAPWAFPTVLGALLLTAAASFGPFVSPVHPFFAQTVEWQMGRAHADLGHRLLAVLCFVFMLNPLTFPALLRRRCPRWVVLGVASGGLFVLSAQVYYHYFIPVVPFAALLSAPLLVRLLERARRLVTVSGSAFLVLWAAALNVTPVQDGLGFLQLSATSATVQLLGKVTAPHDAVLADQFEYTFLAHRTPATDYFWDMQNITDARSLERHLRATGAVVVTESGNPTYPPGFLASLAHRGYVRLHAGLSTIWIGSAAPTRRPVAPLLPSILPRNHKHP